MTYILMVEEGFLLSTKVFYITVAVFAGLLFYPYKTVVIVTHRPAALEICDRVIDFTNTEK